MSTKEVGLELSRKVLLTSRSLWSYWHRGGNVLLVGRNHPKRELGYRRERGPMSEL